MVGEYDTISAAEKHLIAMTDHGADIIDIGGESTRPYLLLKLTKKYNNMNND